MKYKQLFVLGPNPLNNRLLAGHIHSCSGITPHCVYETTELAESAFHSASLFFCDCAQTDAKSYCRKLHRNGLDQKELPSIALLNVQRDEDLLNEIKTYAIQGIFYTSDRFELIEKGIRKVLAGEYWLSRDLLIKSLKTIREGQGRQAGIVLPSLLTMREQEILRLITAGLSNQAVADRLFISPNTVKTHISNIYKKIDSTNRVQAIIWATEFLPFAFPAIEQDRECAAQTVSTVLPQWGGPEKN